MCELGLLQGLVALTLATQPRFVDFINARVTPAIATDIVELYYFLNSSDLLGSVGSIIHFSEPW